MSAPNLPLLFASSGPTPTSPAVLLAALLAQVYDVAPGYTAELPGSLIDDVSGTDVGALSCIDQARVDAVNNVTPYGANAYILAQLGIQFGLPQGLPTNASVYVVFTGSAGYVIPPGFIVSDGSNDYVIQDGGAIATDGNSAQLYAVCTTGNVFAIPADSVDIIGTSVPSPYTLSVTNPQAGTPANPGPETLASYRSRILLAYGSPLTGMATYLKTLLLAIPGVSPRLVSVIQYESSWEVLCGGGDAYEVAGAIYAGMSNIGLLVGSQITDVRNINKTLYDAPNEYEIVFVNPPQATVTVDVTWNTQLPNFTATNAVNQYIIAALQAYLNSILVGQGINVLVMNEVVQEAVAPVLAAANLTTLTYVVKINSSTVTPDVGTWIIPAPDVETYLYCAPSGVTSTQG